MMADKTLLQEFQDVFHREDKAACLQFALSGLETERFDISTLYDDILTPALRFVPICQDNESACIWHEHVKSGIVRAILENCYLHLDRQGKAFQLKLEAAAAAKQIPANLAAPQAALVMCPERELHELGARMAADALTMAGYQTTFAGANTPRHQLLEAFLTIKPAIIAISVTDPYHLVEAQKAIELLFASVAANNLTKPTLLAGGHAFRVNPSAFSTIGATAVTDSFRSLVAWAKQQRTGGVFL